MNPSRARDRDELIAHATAFTEKLSPGRVHATVLALSGELGAGKTTFAQGIAAALGVEETVTSPTFVIEKIYELENQPFDHLIHIDAYRLKSGHELKVLGWEEVMREAGNLILLEWPERVADIIPAHAIRIHFEIEGDGRTITIDGSKENS